MISMDGGVYQRMAARKTASFGQAYNYSQMAYPYQEFLPELEAINVQLGDGDWIQTQ